MSRRRPQKPTVMQYAFLAALRRKFEQHGAHGTVVFPTGEVDASELRKVVIAIACAGHTQVRKMGVAS
jgi:hypothetical protein